MADKIHEECLAIFARSATIGERVKGLSDGILKGA
jgi:hypothetical protein